MPKRVDSAPLKRDATTHKHRPSLEEEEKVFIATAKGRYGQSIPLHPCTLKNMKNRRKGDAMRHKLQPTTHRQRASLKEMFHCINNSPLKTNDTSQQQWASLKQMPQTGPFKRHATPQQQPNIISSFSLKMPAAVLEKPPQQPPQQHHSNTLCKCTLVILNEM